MRVIKVAAAQLEPRRAEESLRVVLRMASEARRLGCSILCLPEAWNVVNPYDSLDKVAESYDETIQALSRASAENSICMVAGGLYRRDEEGSYVIACPVLDSSGDLVGEQLKVHLFRTENKIFRRGEEFRLFNLDGVKLGILVCHDIVYPEAARELVLNGAELILNPSRIISGGVRAWHIYVKARSLENRIPVVAVNVVMRQQYGGGSVAVGLIRKGRGIIYPKTLARAGYREELLTAEINLDDYHEIRQERLGNRNPRAYRALCGEA